MTTAPALDLERETPERRLQTDREIAYFAALMLARGVEVSFGMRALKRATEANLKALRGGA